MKAKEEQDGFNIKLLQILDKIEENMDKETESSKSKRHMSHDERIKTKIFDGHHHHSPRHSVGRKCSSSSSSLIRKHKRRSGVYEIQG
jgi:hypothetical protein